MNKRMKCSLLLLTILIVISISGIIIMKLNIKKQNINVEWNNEFYKVDKNETNYNDNATVEELKENMGMEAESNLYEITEEYDGRKTLNIKANILYKVAFAGIIKKDKPTFEEIDEIFEKNYPDKNGIWVSEQSRDIFLNLIKENSSTEFEINKDGYLVVSDEANSNYANKIKEIINSNKKIIVDINSFDYEVDAVTGEIVEYPFQQLGDYLDIITNDNDKIIVLTANKNINSEEIIKEFVNNI